MRFVVLASVVMLGLFGVATLLAGAEGQQHALAAVPTLSAEVTPGQRLDRKLDCAWSVGDGWQTHCRVGMLTFVVRGDVVKRIVLDTTHIDLTIGQLVLKWGRPLAADYTALGTTAVYWKDRYVYLLPTGPFMPSTAVDSITFTDADQEFDGYYEGGDLHASWHGFATNLSTN
jgi:hypothetical protein